MPIGKLIDWLGDWIDETLDYWFSRPTLTDVIGLFAAGFLYGPGGVAAYIAAQGALRTGAFGPRAFGPRAPQITAQRGDQVRSSFRTERAQARWILGRARVGGWIYSMQEGSDQGPILGYRTLNVAYGLAEDGYTAIERIWINGEEQGFDRVKAASLNAAGTDTIYTLYAPGEAVPAEAPFVPARRNPPRVAGQVGDDNRYWIDLTMPSPGDAPRWAVYPRPGTNGQPAEWVSLFEAPNIPGRGGRNARHLGIAYVQLWQPSPGRDEDGDVTERVVWTGVPNVEFLVKGLKFRWPKDDTGALTDAAAWTDNAAACLWWFLTERMGIPASAIDAPAFRAAYAVCEQEYNVPAAQRSAGWPTTYKRYRIDGVVSAGDDHAVVLREMLFAMAGTLVEFDGRLHMYAGAERQAVKTITDASIIEAVEHRIAPSYRDRVNTATIACAQSAEHDWTTYELPEVVDRAARQRDRSRLAADLGARAFVSHPVRAQMLLAIALRKARAVASHTYRLAPGEQFGAMALVPGERVLVTDGEAGLAGEKMEVVQTAINPDWSVTVVLKDSPDGIYADSLTALPPIERPPPPPPLANVRPPRVQGLRVRTRSVPGSGNVRHTLTVTWTDIGYPVALVVYGPDQFQRRVVGLGGAEEVEVPYSGGYTVHARNVGRGGIEGPAATARGNVEFLDLSGRPPAPGAITFPRFDVGVVVRARGTGETALRMLEEVAVPTPSPTSLVVYLSARERTGDDRARSGEFQAMPRSGDPKRRSHYFVLIYYTEPPPYIDADLNIRPDFNLTYDYVARLVNPVSLLEGPSVSVTKSHSLDTNIHYAPDVPVSGITVEVRDNRLPEYRDARQVRLRWQWNTVRTGRARAVAPVNYRAVVEIPSNVHVNDVYADWTGVARNSGWLDLRATLIVRQSYYATVYVQNAAGWRRTRRRFRVSSSGVVTYPDG